MFDRLRRQVLEFVGRTGATTFADDDPRLAVAALMVHAVAADGVVTTQERRRLEAELERGYGLTARQAVDLYEAARLAEAETSSLQSFTAGLQRSLSVEDRRKVVAALWRLVFADGDLHEFEDNVVGRIGDLLGVPAAERIGLRKTIEADEEAARLHSGEDERGR